MTIDHNYLCSVYGKGSSICMAIFPLSTLITFPSSTIVAIYLFEISDICPVRIEFGTDIDKSVQLKLLKLVNFFHFQVMPLYISRLHNVT